MLAVKKQQDKDTVRLNDLLKGIIDLPIDFDRTVTGLCLDSRRVSSGDLFFAYPGLKADGRAFMQEAVYAGAIAVLCDSESEVQSIEYLSNGQFDVPVISCVRVADQISRIAGRFYGQPSIGIPVVGVTGTNGKSSCCVHLSRALLLLEKQCGLIGTLGAGFPDSLVDIDATTPDAIRVQACLSALRAEGAEAVAMEISSHAIAQKRVAGVDVDVAVWTNLTQDHLDYHQDIETYAKVKAALFEFESLKHAIINVDDAVCRHFLPGIAARMPTITYGLSEESAGLPMVSAEIIHMGQKGTRAKIKTPWGSGELRTKLLGQFNLSNLLAVIAVLGVMEFPLKTILHTLQQLPPVPGRLQQFGGGSKSPMAVVDYAHTPDALKTVLEALREHCHGQLWAVFGCGGNRDQGKRAIMGRIAEQYSDRVIITDDNPRDEDPEQIVRDIQSDLLCPWAVEVIHERDVAIGHALSCAQPGDVVLIAGRGHETMQIVKGKQLICDDSVLVRHHLSRRQVISELGEVHEA